MTQIKKTHFQALLIWNNSHHMQTPSPNSSLFVFFPFHPFWKIKKREELQRIVFSTSVSVLSHPGHLQQLHQWQQDCLGRSTSHPGGFFSSN